MAAKAADGDAIHVGDFVNGGHRTYLNITAATQGETGAFAANYSAGSSGATGSGLFGASDSGPGVDGWGPIGVWGGRMGTSQIGVKGSRGNYSWLSTYADPAKTAVYGIAISEHSSGNPPDPSVMGVYGRTDAGFGVRGRAGIGIGGYFEAEPSGTALQVAGPVRFSSAGINTVQAGTKSKKVSPGIDVESSSKVFVTLMSNPGAGIVLHRVSKDTVNDQFTVYLTGSPSQNVTFAWFVIS